jgi:hypothetical protein
VEKHLAKACAALDVRTRLQAILRARDLGTPNVSRIHEFADVRY